MSRQAYPTQLRDHLGNDVHLPPKPFAVGGEGAVFDVLGKPDQIAKLYSKPQSKERCDKLRAMAKLCSPNLLKIAAWPTATLSNGNPAAVEGILMPRIIDHKEIHHLYSVAQRKKDFPEADWKFLLNTARNCAIAFEEVHKHGHVVGDVNQKNVMVSKKGVVALVDCDSFQIVEGSRVFRCGVGVSDYTPPELLGKTFANLDRAANHDLFGLAVLVFQLLMVGRHPFSGVPLVAADIPIEKAIQDGLYAYTRNPTKLKPPPNVPPVAMLDTVTLDLFERAFGSPRRPTATEWRNALDASMMQLTRCKNDPKHSYPAVAGKCPWCQLIAVAQLMIFTPGQGATGATFRPEDIDQLIRKLAGMQITFAAYMRPRATRPVQVSLPPGLQSVRKPPLLSHPTPPAPVQKPTLASSPPPPVLLPRPILKPLPGVPSLAPKPPLTPHPAAPPPAQKPSLTRSLAARPLPEPPLKPHPLPPIMPPLPTLHPVPRPPVYPIPPPELPGPPDPFLPRLCIVGILAGLLLCFVAKPVGVIVAIAFGAWWVVLMGTQNQRREMARKSLNSAHEYECERMDEEYAEQIQPIEEVNKELTDAWQASKAAITAKYQRLCKGIDDENYRQLAAWEAADAVRKAEHDRACMEVNAINQRLMTKWEVVDSVRRADHDRVCATVDAINRQVLAEWDAKNSATMAVHERARDEIDQANRRVLSAWEAENASRQSAYDMARREIEQENQRLTSAWESLTGTRHAEHERTCRDIDAKNRRLVVDWEAANAPWVAEEKRWRDRVISAEAEVRMLEAEVNAQRTATTVRFQQRKDVANGIVASHSRAKFDYEKELRQAEVDSKKIQMEEHLDKSLIRHAKLKGITGDRILALESFGIETAKDVTMLRTQKVPGIGPVLSSRLLQWRMGLLMSFVPKQTLPESEKNRIASRYAPVLLPLGQSIQGAINELDVIAATHQAREAERVKAIATAVQNVAIAEAHVKAMKVG
ncbi:MAG: Protein kinase protein [Planctomycetota bacterium]|nr:Protein kinase protein [Planctomycetota bacterium]